MEIKADEREPIQLWDWAKS